MTSTHVKDPKKVKAGHAGAIGRWGDRPNKWVRLDELTDEQRRLVTAMIEAAKAENER